MPVFALRTQRPNIDPESWIAPNAVVIGEVTLEKNASIWWNSVVRGDRAGIRIGENSNIQDACVLHTNIDTPLTIGANVSLGHMVMLHGCTIGEGSLIGIGATILNRVVIGKNSLVGARSLVTEGKVFPERSLIMGSPAKVVRELTDEEVADLFATAQNYVANWQRYQQELTVYQSTPNTSCV